MSTFEDNASIKRSISTIVADYYQLTKPGITIAVLASMLVGFVLGSGANINFIVMLHAIVGTYLIAAGTGAHNQFLERNYDGLMKRTAKRPLPDNRIDSKNGVVFSLTLIFTGLAYLIIMVNPIAAGVSLATTLIYLGVYTPLKRISAFNIAIGAIPGALPPVGGWAAANGSIAEPGMWLLFGIVFFWQIPHVMAIAWMCKDDYSGAGFCMVPKNDLTGRKTAFWSTLCLIVLIPITFLMYQLAGLSILFLILGMLFAAIFLFYGIRFALDRTKAHAKQLMFASIAYLPLVWIAVFIDIFF